MITKLRLLLEYHCYPVWLYDKDGDIIDTPLPEELRDDANLDQKFDDLQKRYDALFVDNKKEFSFIGFSSEEEKKKFFKDWNDTVNELIEKTNGKYEIIDDIDKSF